MPVVDHGDGAHVEYTIPPEIESRIPPYFYTALAGELFSVFGWERSREMFGQAAKRGYGDLKSSTSGWSAAFTATCRKLDMDWLAGYYDTLPWYDSDVFDGIIEQKVWRHFIKAGADEPHDYYRYLLTQLLEKKLGKKRPPEEVSNNATTDHRKEGSADVTG